MDEKEIVVKVQDLTKSFQIPLEVSSGLKQKLINILKGRKGYRTFTPLNDVSFEIEKGDFFGIVGRNGSGKSTLLKTIAGIYMPQHGSVQVNGTLVPFIELGVGFNPELTGRENVYLNGALLGFSREEMGAMYNDIVEFAELEEFMDERLKNYSSGMQVRLAFSIAIRAQGDILLLDEVLAVGDEAFQKKCYEYFGSLKSSKKTVILVTHDMGAVERFCNKALMIEKGRIVRIGSNTEVAQRYRDLFIQEVNNGVEKINQSFSVNDGIRDKRIENVEIDVRGKGRNLHINAKEPFTINVEIETNKVIDVAACGLNIVNSQGVIVMSFGYGGLGEGDLTLFDGKNIVTFAIPYNYLNDDAYFIDLGIEAYDMPEQGTILFQMQKVRKFRTQGFTTRNYSITHPEVIVTSTHR